MFKLCISYAFLSINKNIKKKNIDKITKISYMFPAYMN